MGLRARSARPVAGRSVALAVALVLAACGLTACRTNVGSAAVIDGHRVSESDVNDYVTSSAKPITGSNGASIAPKPFVLEILIDRQLYPKVLKGALGSAPTKGQLSTLRRQYLAGSSPKAAVEKLGAVGYSASFNDVVVEYEVYATLLNQAQQEGKDLATVARKLDFTVSVNPRYGRWNAQQLAFDGSATSGLPGYLKLQGASTAKP